MRDLPIAYGNSCYAKTWANKTTTWEDLCERMKTTIRTTETVEEYPKLKKDDRDRAKDKGGFVGGYLKGNRRKRETVVCRSMLTMDADHAEIGFIDRFASECRYSSCLYTTHGHTPEQPRCRIIVPLTRNITPDEYVAFARYFASDWGIDQFDECSYKPSQLMYWPTTPANGEFISKTTEGEWLDPDVYLTAHPNWKDCSLLPTSSRESAVREASGKKQEDPLAKPGVVGAFCRAYGIAAVIETYLADVYEPSAMEGRYDYIPADSSAGVVVYDDKFAYSHHATDPACGKLLNAFDLVRIHRFGDDDEKKSFKQMTELALSDDTVKENLAAERIAQAGEDFSDDADWHKLLHFVPRSGALENSVWNLNLILENDPDLQGFAFNDMANRIQVTGEMPWDRPEGNSFWRDADSAQLKSLVDIRYGEFTTRNYDVSFTKVADDRHFHPVRDYLNGLPKWDGVKRVEELFIKYLQADDIETGIQLLTSLVAALPDIIMAIVEAIPKIIDGIINAVLNAIPLIIQAGIDLLISLIQALPQIITTIVQAIPQIISGIVNALIGNIDKIIMAGVQLFVALIENLPTIIVEIVKAVPQIITGIVKAFGSLMYKIVEIGGNIVKGLWSGITQLASWLWDKVSGWISSIWDGICDFFGIHSPSKEMAWVGEMLVKGLAGSIDDNGDEAVKAAEGMAEDINGVMGNLAHDMQTALPTDFDVNGSIRTAVDGLTGKAASVFTIALNIATFNNYSSEDIRQLTNEVMETANQFAQRKGVVFA